MNYNTIKFEIFLSETPLLELKNSISKFLSEYDDNVNYNFFKDFYKDCIKLEFLCNKEYAFEIISIIKNFSKDTKIEFNILPIIN